MYEIKQLLRWLCYTELTKGLETSVEKPVYFLKVALMLPILLVQIIETEEEKQKMERLYDEYEQLLYCVAFKYMHDKYRAEDVVHDTFLKIIDRLDSINEIRCPQTRAYLVTITEHLCINMLKSKAYKTEQDAICEGEMGIAEIVPDKYNNAEDQIFEKDDVLIIKDALRKLPEKLQNTLILYAVEGYSMKEIAEIDNCSVEAVKKRIQRARMQILELVKE